jgi:hypothetical protein
LWLRSLCLWWASLMLCWWLLLLLLLTVLLLLLLAVGRANGSTASLGREADGGGGVHGPWPWPRNCFIVVPNKHRRDRSALRAGRVGVVASACAFVGASESVDSTLRSNDEPTIVLRSGPVGPQPDADHPWPRRHHFASS